MIPDRLIMNVPGIAEDDCESLAKQAVKHSVGNAPRLTGNLIKQLEPVWGEGFFGIRWTDDYVWNQEAGFNPFTMKSLAGKVIPMWLDDPDGEVKRENPKAQQRNMSGRAQTLIFRRAANFGERKTVKRDGRMVDVPRSYPGAPGRINRRMADGRIAQGNVGVRWRHPGLSKRGFLRNALEETCRQYGLPVGSVRDQFGRWR